MHYTCTIFVCCAIISQNYPLADLVVQQVIGSLTNPSLPSRSLAIQFLADLLAKHDFDSRYREVVLRPYIAQIYFPILQTVLILFNISVLPQ